jgi:DNA primase
MYEDWKQRIIFPIHYENRLVSWVGRTINKFETLHYRDLSIDESVRHPKFCLYEYDFIKDGGNILYVTEGVMDCLKLNWYLPYKDTATCLFTNSMTEQQRELLWKVGKSFKKVVILLDNDALSNALEIKSQLKPVLNNVIVGILPSKYKDPGELGGSLIESGKFLF